MTEEVTDAAIVERCRSGDIEAFGVLIDRYQRPIYVAVLHKVWNPEDARELCQQTFLNAFEHLDSFNPAFKFFSWIYRIAMNETINHLKSRRPHEPLLDDLLPAGGEDPESAYASAERGQRIRRALAALDEKYRSVVILCHLLQLSYRDAAESLGLDEKTVKSRLFSARELLRDQLLEMGHAR